MVTIVCACLSYIPVFVVELASTLEVPISVTALSGSVIAVSLLSSRRGIPKPTYAYNLSIVIGVGCTLGLRVGERRFVTLEGRFAAPVQSQVINSSQLHPEEMERQARLLEKNHFNFDRNVLISDLVWICHTECPRDILSRQSVFRINTDLE